MCRLFGVFSKDTVDARHCMQAAPRSLLRQSHVDKKRRQGDGWGVGWFESGRPRIVKSPRPIYNDLHRLGRAVKQPSGTTLLGHVRWASNPLKLPKRELIGYSHTQPFSHGPWLFIHNGTLYIPREVRAALGPWARFIKGKNDSEVLFYWLLKTLIHKKGRWSAKLRASLRGLDRIWKGCRKRYPIYKYPYHGLNWVLTNDRIFLAFCYVDPRGQAKSKALCNPRQPYYELQVRETPREVIVSSEPLDSDAGWRPLGHGKLLVAEKRRGAISTSKIRVI